MDYDPQPLSALIQAQASVDQLAAPGAAFARFYGLEFPDLVKHRWLESLAVGDQRIALHHFVPVAPEGTLVLIHGYQDHHGLYGHLIRYALSRKLAVLCFDLPGHGLSTGPRASIDDFARYQEVLAAVLGHQQGLGWPEPLHLMGQSTGGAIINHYLLSERPALSGSVILLAPLVHPHRWWAVKLTHALVGPFRKAVPRVFTANSHDPRFLHFLHHEDPLQAHIIPVAWVTALKRWLPRFQRLAPAPEYHVLIIQGTADRTVDWRYNLKVLKEKLGVDDICYLSDGRHHLANESKPMRERYLRWLDEHWQPCADC